jgi:uncharacterized repeat protein (TIGR03943 family)
MDYGRGAVRSPEKYLKQWLHPMVFGIWTYVLIYLVVTQRYTDFLRPEFGILLALAHFIAMGFMLAAVGRKRIAETDFSGVVRGLVLLLPVLYLFAMPDSMLAGNTFKNRFVGPSKDTVGKDDRSGKPVVNRAGKDPGPASPDENDAFALQDRPLERTILELYSKPEVYKGKRVTFTGMIMRDEVLKQYFAGRDTAIYRFLITCCAADALPLAIAVDSNQASAFTNDQWVQVDGVFNLGQGSDKPFPLVENAIIKRIKAPKLPYLF